MILIHDGNVHLKTGEVKTMDILIEGNRIKAMGHDLVPKGADTQVIDAKGKEVFPGFIVPCTSVGLCDFTDFKQGDHNEATDPSTPQLNVKDALDRREVLLQQYHYSGITAFGAAPGASNVIAGQMGVYHTAGKSEKDMCIKEFAALKGNYMNTVKRTYGKRSVAPMTKMGMASILRNALLEAKKYAEKEEKPFDPKQQAMGKILSKEVPFVVTANTASEINGIIEIAKEFDLRLVINSAYQPEQCQGLMGDNQIPVLLGQPQSMGYAVAYETDYPKIIEMMRTGATIGISNSGDSDMAGRETLLWGAIKLVQAGADAEEVIQMMTINNATALGVEDQIGSLEENKLADIVIFNEHPAKSYQAYVEVSIIAGEIVHQGRGGFEKCCL